MRQTLQNIRVAGQSLHHLEVLLEQGLRNWAIIDHHPHAIILILVFPVGSLEDLPVLRGCYLLVDVHHHLELAVLGDQELDCPLLLRLRLHLIIISYREPSQRSNRIQVDNK